MKLKNIWKGNEFKMYWKQNLVDREKDAELRHKIEKIEDNKLKHNGSGYVDPTAYRAIKNVERRQTDPDYKRFRDLLGCVLRICEMSDFQLVGRIEVKDLRNGKVWR